MVILSGIWNKLLLKNLGDGFGGYLKKETEEMICAAQEHALRTTSVKCYIGKTSDSPSCKLCGKISETMWHIVSGCANLRTEGV